MAQRTCSIEDCGKPTKARGLCPTHYHREFKRGTLADHAPSRQYRSGNPENFRCSVEGCDRQRTAEGLCQVHLYRKRYLGDVQAHEPVRAYRRNEPCSVEGCDRKAGTRGLCALHYTRWHRYGDPLQERGKPTQRELTCAIPDCGRQAKVGGLCGSHYQRQKKYGDPFAGRGRRGDGSMQSKGYRMIGKRLEHRVIMEGLIGRPLEPYETVHHKNGNRTDNRPENLELWIKKAHVPGQRLEDQLQFARELIARYDSLTPQE